MLLLGSLAPIAWRQPPNRVRPTGARPAGRARTAPQGQECRAKLVLRGRLDSIRGGLLNAAAGPATGRVAQRESTPFTRVGSQVQSLSRPPFIINDLPEFFALTQILAPRYPHNGATKGCHWSTRAALSLSLPSAILTTAGWLRISHAEHRKGALGPCGGGSNAYRCLGQEERSLGVNHQS